MTQVAPSRREDRRSLRDGTPGQRALFTLVAGLFLAAVGFAVADKLDRIGRSNVGWLIDSGYVSPSREDVSEAGLRGGGRAVEINGVPLGAEPRGRLHPPSVRWEIGASNTLTFRTPSGAMREITIEVRPWTWHDVLFTEGATDVIALLFFVVGVATFALRPWEKDSWALLVLGSLAASSLATMFLPLGAPTHYWSTVYFLVVVGLVVYAPAHLALAFPVVHPLLLHRIIVWAIYLPGAIQAVMNIVAWENGYRDGFIVVRAVGAAAMLATNLFFLGRTVMLSLSSDALVRQRARILLAGGLVGLTPFAVAQFLQQVVGVLAIDARFVVWPLGVFVLALARVTLRQELMNARVTVRRAFLYTGAVAVLTAVAWLLIAFRPYAVAALLFPLLYLWPRFAARLDRRFYPQRQRFPELVREIGAQMAAATSADVVLDTLLAAARRLCDASSTVAFLFAGAVDERAHRRGTDVGLAPGAPIADEPLVDLLRSTRREIRRERLAVEPAYANVRAECEAGFDRLRAVLLLPLVRERRVIGGLAVGPRATGDLYEDAEVDALSTAVQHAVQAIVRIEATERLRARELEFADLKRFFPPQIIDQVMARGGASELRSQRKQVTVVFADLRGFTSFSDSVEPEEVMATLAEYHAAMGRRVAEYAGTLERFAGDGFMVFFNDPVEQPDHAERAVKMSIAMRADIEELRERWLRKAYQIHIGIGIDTGYATCGFIGYEGRRDYGVIGNVTNLAARLSDTAAPGEILISARVFAELSNGARVEPVGELTLKGFHQPQQAYRLLAA